MSKYFCMELQNRKLFDHWFSRYITKMYWFVLNVRIMNKAILGFSSLECYEQMRGIFLLP